MSSTRDLILAYVAWDRWCRKQAKSRRRPGPMEGDRVSSVLVDELVKAAEVAGVPHMVLRNRIVAGVREGLSVEQAVSRATRGAA